MTGLLPTSTTPFLLALMLLVVLANAPKALALSAQEVEDAISKEAIFDAGTKLVPFLSGDEAVVRVRLPVVDVADTADYKIDAVLVGKAILTAEKTIAKITVRFYIGSDAPTYKEVVVRAVDVKAFGAGIISKDELLRNLDLKDGSDTKTGDPSTAGSPVATSGAAPSGALSTERRALQERILVLKARGVGVKPFLERLRDLEQEAEKGPSAKLSDDLEALSDSVSDQEKMLVSRDLAEKARAAQAKSDQEKALLTKQLAAKEQQLAAVRAAQSKRQSQVGALKSVLGGMCKFLPEQGPCFWERAYVATCLNWRVENGQDVSLYTSAFDELNQCARANQANEVRSRLYSLCLAMKIKQPEEAMPDNDYFSWMQSQHQKYLDALRPAQHRPNQ